MAETRITRSVSLGAPIEDVWRALTDPVLLSDWLGEDVTLDVQVGGAGTVVEPDGVVRLAVVEDVQDRHRLAFRWWPADGSGPASTVELELAESEADGGGTRLIVTETVVAPASASTGPTASAASTADFRWAVRFLLLGCCLLRVAVACR